MKHSRRGLRDRPFSRELVGLGVLTLCFAGAGLAGCLAVSVSGDAGTAALTGYLTGYMDMVEEGTACTASALSAMWSLCRWPLLVFLLGMTALGAVGIPAAFCVRGFLLGYSVSSFARVFGTPGLTVALAVFSMTALVSVPVFFCMGAVALPNALRLAAGVLEGRPVGALSGEPLWTLIPCACLLGVATALECALVPHLVRAAAGGLPVL